MLTTQAATVLAVYRRIARTVTALEPERVKDVSIRWRSPPATSSLSTAIELLLQVEEHHHTEGIPIAAALNAVVRRSAGRAAARAGVVVAGPGHRSPRESARHARAR